MGGLHNGRTGRARIDNYGPGKRLPHPAFSAAWAAVRLLSTASLSCIWRHSGVFCICASGVSRATPHPLMCGPVAIRTSPSPMLGAQPHDLTVRISITGIRRASTFGAPTRSTDRPHEF
jgi:hypothetical protein